jgi:hypothetical protein
MRGQLQSRQRSVILDAQEVSVPTNRSAYVDLGESCATVDMGGQLTYHRKLGGTDEEICEFY